MSSAKRLCWVFYFEAQMLWKLVKSFCIQMLSIYAMFLAFLYKWEGKPRPLSQERQHENYFEHLQNAITAVRLLCKERAPLNASYRKQLNQPLSQKPVHIWKEGLAALGATLSHAPMSAQSYISFTQDSLGSSFSVFLQSGQRKAATRISNICYCSGSKFCT